MVLIVTSAIVIILLRPAAVSIPQGFTSTFTLQNGYKVNYNPAVWEYKFDETLGSTLNNKTNSESIVFSVSQIEKQVSEEALINDIIQPLKKDNISIEKSKEIIDNIEFNKIVIIDKGDENIIKNDQSISYLKLDGNIYTSITIVNVVNSADDAIAVVNTIRK